MSLLTPAKVYDLLPAIYRLRDAEQEAPLAALLALAARAGARVEADIAQLYDDWFIETCEEWVVPYLGDLLGVRGLHALENSAFSQRARVANTLGYRRRKGTATMLEQLARDTTGWPARAVEYFELLAWNQHFNHVRPEAHRTPDLRRTGELEMLNTAFDKAAHTVDIRRIALDRGRHNLPNAGLFLWRLQSYFVPGGSARPTAAPGFYAFHPVAGQERPLFNRPQTELEITHLAEEFNVPGPLRRRPLYEVLERRRQILLAGGTPRGPWFGGRAPVVQIARQTVAEGEFETVPAEQIRICHLGPGAARPDPTEVAGIPTILVGVDPVLGLLAWADTLPVPLALKVSYAYGFSGDLGGGPYQRTDSVETFLQQRATPRRAIHWQAGVSREPAPVATGPIFSSLADALDQWHDQPDGTTGVIALMDSHSYAEDLTIRIPAGSRLLIVAANWPAVPAPGGGAQRIPGQLDPVEVRPHLRGQVTVIGTAAAGDEAPGTLALDGLLIEGALTVGDSPGNLGRLRLAHTTLVPASGGLTVAGNNAHLAIEIVRSICGPIHLPASAPGLRVADSIIDAGGNVAIAAEASAVEVQNTTVFGRTEVRTLDAGNAIFTGLVRATRRQAGCVRFCFVPVKSATGRRFRCQPELAVATAEQAATAMGGSFDSAEAAAVIARVVPVFTAEDYGHPAYAQLSGTCPVEIATGAEDGAEMGAFRFLQQPQRAANLRASLDEYLRFGLEAGLIFAT